MVHCTNCDAELGSKALGCVHCGAALDGALGWRPSGAMPLYRFEEAEEEVSEAPFVACFLAVVQLLPLYRLSVNCLQSCRDNFLTPATGMLAFLVLITLIAIVRGRREVRRRAAGGQVHSLLLRLCALITLLSLGVLAGSAVIWAGGLLGR
ncbi:hypothetical protein RQP53_02430 [Paucibacter sp. APW11]|uniref:Zinc ribbon domain-containing protein n=1 Tax=Roseateles aquae TaxID=3077235 RepID=A0ABU3P8Q7_9BURK|nr:hypothetical protein [Paucibacter sp. APW11]MDT8998126.1 hypothetical protein [Paucibacter sp. APW11]